MQTYQQSDYIWTLDAFEQLVWLEVTMYLRKLLSVYIKNAVTVVNLQITLHYIKSYLECPKSLAPLEHYIKGVVWEYIYEGKHLEKR